MVMTRSYLLAVFTVMVALALLLMLPSIASAAPANDNFANAQTISGQTASVDGTIVGATAETGEYDYYSGNSVWYRWTAPETKSMSLDTCNSNFSSNLSVFTGSTLDSLTRVASDGVTWDGVSCSSSGSSPGRRFRLDATEGTTYHIRVSQLQYFNEGNFTLKLQPVVEPPNDNFADAHVISGQTASVDGTNVWATREDGDPTSVAEYVPTSHTVWHRWTAPFSGPVRMDTCTSDSYTMLAVYTGSTLGSLTERISSYPRCGRGGEVRFNATEDTTYQILVDGYHYSSMGIFTLDVNLSHKIDCRIGQTVCTGTDTSDRINGTRSKDNIQAGGGDDWIFAVGANDIALGGEGEDVINGYDGQDRLYGGDGDDVIYTGGRDEDKDSVTCGEGWDKVWREKGKDRVAADCEAVRTGSGGGGGY